MGALTPAALVEALEREISARREAIVVLERALAEVRGAEPSGFRKHATPKRRGAIAAGSLEDRVLQLAAGPTTLAAIVDGANARDPDVRKAVAALVASGRMKREGKSRATRYRRA